jgi:hypothetical protein
LKRRKEDTSLTMTKLSAGAYKLEQTKYLKIYLFILENVLKTYLKKVFLKIEIKSFRSDLSRAYPFRLIIIN